MRLLIVDDDAPFAHMLAGQLQKLEPSLDVVDVATAAAARQAVQEATFPFDAFLLDHRLDGSDVDGVTLMGQLLQSSPESGAIICTGYDDSDTKQAASQAGAYWYLSKPFQTWDVIHILRQLDDRIRLQTLNQIAADMQEAVTVHDVADAIVRGALRFGFQRARLRLFAQEGQEANDDPEMIGMSQAGSPRIEGFEGLRTPLTRLLYSQRAIQVGKPLFFKGRELGPGGADEFYAAHDVQPPVGDWVKIPLLSGEHRIGTLTLDNADRDCAFEPQQRAQLTLVLGLFGKQAAAALERARLHEQTSQQAEEAEIMSAIGRRITTEAAKGQLDDLFDEVRHQVGSLMDVTNFMVVLSDLETNALDFRRQYEGNELQDRHWRAADAGLSGFVVTQNETVLTDDTEAFRARHGIMHYGHRAECWLGVPLQVEGRAKGALVVQSYRDKAAYSERDQRLLTQLADQVAGAIQLAYRLEREDELKRQAAALEKLKEVMRELIRESEDLFWHAVLTTITHRDGNSYNRAILFWYDDAGKHLLGRMAIGQLNRKEARLTWEHDRDADHTLESYFNAPRRAWTKPTPLQRLLVGERWPVGAKASPCRRTWVEGQRLECRSDALRGCLPDVALFPPDLWDDKRTFDCALLPVRSPVGVLGVLMVDNAFDSEPLRSGDLGSLERVLNAAIEVWLQAAERRKVDLLGERYETMLALERKIIAGVAERPLKQSIEELCRQSQVFSGADAVVIYPYQASSGTYNPDMVSHVGLKQGDEFDAKRKDKPRQQGVTFNVLQSGTLAVPDVSRSPLSFGGHRLAEHRFLQREEIQALIAAPMRHGITGKSLGVIYLDYRSPQSFDAQAIALAEHLASIGAAAISVHLELERQTHGRVTAERSEKQRGRDMEILRKIQAQALGSDTDQEKMVRAILQNAAALFDGSVDATLVLVDWEGAGEQRREVRRDYHRTPQGRMRSKRVEPSQGLVGQALLGSTPRNEQNAIACAVRRGVQSIGAILLKKRDPNASFTSAEGEVVEQLATVAALALESTRSREHLAALAGTFGAVSDPKGLRETLERVVDYARKVVPDIDCITLWYADAETKEAIAGPQWNVSQDKHKGPNASANRIVQKVMKRRKPLFAPIVEREMSLWGDFVNDEGIVSAAAFPLRFGTEQLAFGALFFNYRKAHEFTAAERKLLETFANAAATAIHSAQTLDLAERRRKRMETALTVATKAGASLDLNEVLCGILTALRDEFQRDPVDDTRPYIMLYDERDRVLELPDVARGFYQPDREEYQARVRLSLDGSGITTDKARQALNEGRITLGNVPDVHRESYYVEVNSKTKSEMCAGLVNNGRLLGALVIKSNRLAAFNAEDEKLFEMAAYQVAIALDRLERAARAQRDASTAGAMAWAADIAHDLNSAVGFIRNRAYWLKGEQQLSEEGISWAKEIDERARQLADLARGARSQPNDPTPFSLMGILQARTASWCEKNDSNVQICFLVEDSIPQRVLAHKEQTWSAVRHLLSNAVEAMEQAGSRHRKIDLRLVPTDSYQIELQIEDTGPGIPDDGRRRIFREPYSTKNRINSGYGLLIAQSLIESMNGSIYLYPAAPGRGACFGIRLPLATEKE